MVKEVAGMCLLPAVENRDPLETKFAKRSVRPWMPRWRVLRRRTRMRSRSL